MWKNIKSRLPEFDRDDFLEALGLEVRRGAAGRVLGGFAILGAGVLLGVGLGFILAPKPGRELRQDLRMRLTRGQQRAQTNGHHAELGSPESTHA